MSNDDPHLTLDTILRRIEKGAETALDVAREALGEGPDAKEKVSIVLANRKLQPEDPRPPLRAESPPRAHVFNDVAGFVAYLEKFGTRGTVILADVAAQRIGAVLNETAGDGRELLSLAPVLHPLFAPWAAVIDDAIEIGKFALFLTKHRSAIVHGREIALLFSQVRIAKHITIHKGHGLKALNGVICQTEVQGAKSDVPVELPESITLHVPIYAGTEAQDIEVDLTLLDSDESVAVALTSANLQEAATRTFEAMLAAIRDCLGKSDDPPALGLGRLGYGDWKYLK